MDFWGRAGGLSIVVPYAFANTSSSAFQASTNGVSDIGFLWQINIFGGPALTREQFRTFIPQTFSSFHLYIGTPLGTYNPTSPINPSANRWMMSPTINYSYTPDRGRTWIETYFTGPVFHRQRQFLVNGAQTLSQNPIFRVEEHHKPQSDGQVLAVGRCLLQCRRRDEHRWNAAGQRREHARVGAGGDASLARRRTRAQLRVRRRQAGRRARIANDTPRTSSNSGEMRGSSAMPCHSMAKIPRATQQSALDLQRRVMRTLNLALTIARCSRKRSRRWNEKPWNVGQC